MNKSAKNDKKLLLTKETVRSLSDEELGEAAGGSGALCASLISAISISALSVVTTMITKK